MFNNLLFYIFLFADETCKCKCAHRENLVAIKSIEQAIN